MNNKIELSVYLNTLRQKGYLAYEYNPFHNFQTDIDLYEVETDVGKVIIPKFSAVNTKNGEILSTKNGLQWIDKRGQVIKNIKTYENGKLYAEAGSLIDLDTELLNFDLEHPVNIEVQPSYDGSVNLILNDDKNIPRLINSRFSAREKNSYEIVDRIGENDTNIYNSDTFDKDTSLYFQYEYNPIVKFDGYMSGKLQVGQYCFYFTYCDSDDNESDYITETGLIPVFIGNDGDPYSMDGGIKNQESNKGIRLVLSNLDKSYNYLKIYYLRYFADYQQNRVYECRKINKKYSVNSDRLYIQITGQEEYEEIDPNILNLSRFNPKSIYTQAQCKNMLFFGNIVKNSDNYKELQDCALRIVPSLKIDNIKTPSSNYEYNSGYYESELMYNNVGYFNEEFYRFGVVFIYQNGSLSNVYNTLGLSLNENNTNVRCNKSLFKEINSILYTRNYIQVNDQGWINDDEYLNKGNNEVKDAYYLNSKGVCNINYSNENFESKICGIKFTIPNEVIKYLKSELGIRGLFFVRQKCVPNILAQCFLLPMDDVLQAPIIQKYVNNTPKYTTECFVSQDGKNVINSYSLRTYNYTKNPGISGSHISQKIYAAICPDFLLNQPYFNQIFNGNKFKLKKVYDTKLQQSERFYNYSNIDSKNNSYGTVIINTVTEDVPTVAIKDQIFRLEIGKAQEAYRFRYAEVDKSVDEKGEKNDSLINSATNIVRGIYSPYLAIYSDNNLDTSALYNIYQDSFIDTTQEYQTRMDSSEPFYAISDRYNFDGLSNDDKENKTLVCWRGDCYINTFTYRLNRNFNDSSLPNNDQIIQSNTWREHYQSQNPEEWSKISRSDINAVQMGSWITFKLKSSMNYALRSEDHSYVSEEALMGAPRSFYPKSTLLWRGENKMPDSYLYNDAYRASLGFKCYFAQNDINYIKNTFSNRIQYSAVSIQDSFKNNYRESLSTYFRDYSQEYGGIVKLIGFEGYLLVVFEHAIGVAVINERILAGQSDGEPVFINTKNVLPEELTIITDTYGTQWPESVIKSEAGFIYGVDTIAKKIWRIKGQQIEILSDFKVNKFLIDNISLGERELSPIIGLKNVKTHYNNNKKDIMFTFYDDIYKDEEKVWNLCYNELLDQFITFYSWVPSYSENIDTKFFTFDRRTSKNLTLLSKSNYSIPENKGVLVDSPILKDTYLGANLYYRDTNAVGTVTIRNADGTTYQREVSIDDKEDSKNPIENGLINNIKFKLEKDHWGNWKHVKNIDNNMQLIGNKVLFDDEIEFNPVVTLSITPYLKYTDVIESVSSYTLLKTETVAFTTQKVLNNKALTSSDKEYANLTTDFYLHGQAGIFNIAEDLYPTYWYGEYHPFEFEFVVNDKIAQQKLFENLVLISNKAEPESFHFEIEGDNYEFSSDKRNMYFRQEATKNLFQNLGSDIIYNRKFTDVVANKLTQEQYYRAKDDKYINQYNKIDKVYPIEKQGLVQQVKSTIFPLYYNKIDTFNEIYHTYNLMKGEGFDFQNLSGSEISWNRDLNQFNIITHIKNTPVDKFGRLRGNSYYKEGKWNIQIPSITFMQKNEDPWLPLNQDFASLNVSGFKLCSSVLCGNDRLGTSKANYKYSDLLIEGPLRDTTIPVPPIVINASYPLASDFQEISIEDIPNIYYGDNYTGIVEFDNWTYRKEAKIRDKWIKVRIRYSGKNLAIIHSIATLYNVSYS